MKKIKIFDAAQPSRRRLAEKINRCASPLLINLSMHNKRFSTTVAFCKKSTIFSKSHRLFYRRIINGIKGDGHLDFFFGHGRDKYS